MRAAVEPNSRRVRSWRWGVLLALGLPLGLVVAGQPNCL